MFSYKTVQPIAC